jgi:hypothetical protein
VSKAAVDLGLEPAPRRVRRASVNIARAWAQHAGYGVGYVPAPAACPWTARPVQAGRPAQVALSHSSTMQVGRARRDRRPRTDAVPLGRKRIWPIGLWFVSLFFEYIQILANSKICVGFIWTQKAVK